MMNDNDGGGGGGSGGCNATDDDSSDKSKDPKNIYSLKFQMFASVTIALETWPTTCEVTSCISNLMMFQLQVVQHCPLPLHQGLSH